ncbi:hypothetical protein OMB55_00015090 [gamma proteobacterium HIMB55]|nr:hypothetical protein OMB55_00015090 [gamma proteobacterium HIMB55]
MRISSLGSNKFIRLDGTLAQSATETLNTQSSPSQLPYPSGTSTSGSSKNNENSEGAFS